MRITVRQYVTSAVLALLAAIPATAQLMDQIPHASYYAGVQSFYSGEYRSAERELRRETQHGVRTSQSSWIDSICYHAMLGEVLYHEGLNAESLAEFDQACQLYLAYPNWLLQVKFQTGANGPRPEPNRARRMPPWGKSSRNFVLGQFPQSEKVLIGDLDAQRAYQQGGVVREPMYWRVNVVEIMRMTALAIRRRNELLGPLAIQDPISKELSVVLSRGNLAPANHWSAVWIDLLRGLAEEGMGKLNEADMLLGRSIVVNGQLDHPLTCVALLEQGRIAMRRGDTRRAAQLLAEAGFSAFYFDNPGVVTESAIDGWINHMASGAAGMYPLLDSIAAWAQANRLRHTAVTVRLAQAESLLWQGQVPAGAALVEESGRRLGEMRGCVPAIHQLYLQAVVRILQGKAEAGGEILTRALAAQSGASLRNFQIERTNQMYDARTASPRLAVDFYKSLLADPTLADWARNSLDAMAVLQTDQTAAFDRWFIASLERKDAALALEIAERAKRRQYLASQPLGGRLLALRAILESPVASLDAEAVLERQRILAGFAAYQTLDSVGQKIHDQLVASPILASNPSETKMLNALYDAWERNATDRQQMLLQIAVRRLPSSCEFPPFFTTAELQKSLGKRESLIEFHTAAGNMYGFVLTATDVHIWQLPDAHRLKAGLANFLKAIGNYGANRQISVAELKGDAWRDASKEADVAVFGDARLDLAKTTSLIIVPDDLLWYVPFEALTPGGANGDRVLGDLFPIRYGPTAALAVARPQPLRRVQHAGIVANDLKFASDSTAREMLLQELESDLAGPLVLGETLSRPTNLISPLLDQLIVMDDLAPNAGIGESPSLLPQSRGAKNNSLNAWITLPFGGPEQIVLTGVATEAEQGLKTTKRGAHRMRPGGEVFQSLCNLMAGGARTILMTRWRTGGRTNFDLVREFAKEGMKMPAADAWQRACLLAREAPLDVFREPRLKRSDNTGELPTADHPFFWAGYLLVDTGPRPEPVEPQEPAEVATKDTAKGHALPAPAKLNNAASKTPPGDDANPDVETAKSVPAKDAPSPNKSDDSPKPEGEQAG